MCMLFLSIFMFLSLHGADKPISRIPTLTQLACTRIEKLFQEEDPQFLKSVAINAPYYDDNFFISEFLRKALIKKGPVLDAILERIGTPQQSLIGVYNAYAADQQVSDGYIISKKNTIEWGREGKIYRSISVERISTITSLAPESDGSVYFATQDDRIVQFIPQDTKYGQIYQKTILFFPMAIKSMEIIDNTMLIQLADSEYKVLIKENETWNQDRSFFTPLAQLVKKNNPKTALSTLVNIFYKTPPALNREQYYNITALPLSEEGKRILLKNCMGDPILYPKGESVLYPTATGINECAVNRGFSGECANVYTDPDQKHSGAYGILSCHPTRPLVVITCTKKDVTAISILNLITGKNFPFFKTSPYTVVNAIFTEDGQNILLAIQDTPHESDKTIYHFKVPMTEELQKIPLFDILHFLNPPVAQNE